MNTASYNQLVSDHADGMFRYACKMLGDRERAQDVVQGVFERVWLKRAEVQIEKAKAYLFTSVYRACIDDIRRGKRYADADPEVMEGLKGAGDESDSESFEIRDAVRQALAALPEVQRSLILLRDYEGYSYEEMAEMCGLTESQVKVYLFRARQKLKTALAYLKHA